MGRKALKKEDVRRVRSVRLSQTEWELVSKAAARKGVTASRWLRVLAVTMAMVTEPPK